MSWTDGAASLAAEPRPKLEMTAARSVAEIREGSAEDDVALECLAEFTGTEGVLFVGRALR